MMERLDVSAAQPTEVVMSLLLVALYSALLPLQQAESTMASAAMKTDVARLVAAAEALTEAWPSQAPPAVPEVALVARHGKPVVPLLTALLSDDADVARDRKRWQVQQQASLALCRIYSESAHCGRVYCDGDPQERIANVKKGWLSKIASDAAVAALPASDLIAQFKREPVFYRQFEIGRALAETGEQSAIRELESLLTADDRHVRGNAAYVLARLGDPRGFDAIAQILADRSERQEAQGIPGAKPSSQAQISADRYYAAHLLGDLKDARGVSLLISLLSDRETAHIVPWSLGQIADPRAIRPLIHELESDDPSTRVLAILALEQMNAVEALPRLRELLLDERRSNFGNRTTVGEAAKHAIVVISGR